MVFKILFHTKKNSFTSNLSLFQKLILISKLIVISICGIDFLLKVFLFFSFLIFFSYQNVILLIISLLLQEIFCEIVAPQSIYKSYVLEFLYFLSLGKKQEKNLLHSYCEEMAKLKRCGSFVLIMVIMLCFGLFYLYYLYL